MHESTLKGEEIKTLEPFSVGKILEPINFSGPTPLNGLEYPDVLIVTSEPNWAGKFEEWTDMRF